MREERLGEEIEEEREGGRCAVCDKYGLTEVLSKRSDINCGTKYTQLVANIKKDA